MVEYSLAKAEVEGSSPFFRLDFFPFSSLLQKQIFFVAYRRQYAKRWLANCHDSGHREGTLWVLSTRRNRCCAHIIRITNDGAENNRGDGGIKRYGESLAPFCLPLPHFGPRFQLPANLRKKFFFSCAPRKATLRGIARIQP